MLALAMKIASGEKDNAEAVEAVLARAGDAKADGNRYLVGDGGRSSSREPWSASGSDSIP